ncbi:MAG: VWA domain-containing protein [Deltaproteobacteria bacterium]|nr:VWA domain-containing protein [Deltaproteobacteria bacterium]
MKALIPYAILGFIGAAGAILGRPAGGLSRPDAAGPDGRPPAPVPTATATSFRVEAGLDRTVQARAGGDAFARVAVEGIADTNAKRLPMSLTLVIDRSGSMAGRKMEDAKRAATAAIDALSPGDRVSVVSFDDGAVDHGSATVGPAGAADLAALKGAIGALFGRHGTDMIAGLDVGGAAASRSYDDARVNRLLLLSDGRPNQEPGLRERVAALAGRGVLTTTLGLGQDYNEDLMAALADQGRGHYYFVDRPEQLAAIFTAELSSLSSIVAKEATIELTPAKGTRIVEVIGFASHADPKTGAVTVAAGDVYGGRVTDILVRLALDAGTDARDVLSVRASASALATGARETVEARLAAGFSGDADEVARSAVQNVAVKVEKWRAAQAWVEANRMFDSNDLDGGNRLLTAAQARLEAQSQALGSEELKQEQGEMGRYQKDNNDGGAGWRGVGTRAAKKKAWSLNKGSAY